MSDEILKEAHAKAKRALIFLDQAVDEKLIGPNVYYKGMVKIAHIYLERNFYDWAIEYLLKVPNDYFDTICLEQIKKDDVYRRQAEEIVNAFYANGYMINMKGNPNVIN